jgi:lysophospholipase L1-like esterase
MKKLFLIIFGFVLGLVLLESGLRIFSLLEKKSDEKMAEENINESDLIHQYDENLGWSLVPESIGRHKTAEFDVTYSINSDGLRDGNYSIEKSNKKRVAVFGDSFTFGIGMDKDKTFAGLLEEESGYEVLNFGVSGYDPGQYFLALKERGMKYDPDAVIFAIYLGNDIEDVALSHPFTMPEFKPYFSIEDGRLAINNIPVPESGPETQIADIDYRVKNVKLYEKLGWILKLKTVLLGKNFLKESFYPSLEKMGLVKSISDYSGNFELMAAILKETKNFLGEKNFSVLMIPSKNVKNNYLEKKFGEELAEILKAEGVPFSNLVPLVSSSEENYYLRGDGHFNEAGNGMAAAELKLLLKE